MRNLNSTMVVSMNDSRQRMCKTHIFQQPAKREKFKSSTVFYLSARTRHNVLILPLFQALSGFQREAKWQKHRSQVGPFSLVQFLKNMTPNNLSIRLNKDSNELRFECFSAQPDPNVKCLVLFLMGLWRIWIKIYKPTRALV